MARTPSAGRRKIEIELIESKVRRQVTLSKRRQGLFNKAHELATLCGVEVAVLVPSLSGNVIHSFGSPNVDHVINRFLDPALLHSGGATVAGGENAASRELDAQLAEVMSQATEAKKTNAELSRQVQRLPLPSTLPELLEMKKKMEDLKAAVAERIEELSVAEALQSLSSV